MLLTKKLSGEISIVDKELLERAIESNEEFRILASEFGSYFDNKKTTSASAVKLDQTWALISTAEKEGFKERFDYSSPKKTIFIHSPLFKVAAMLLIFVSAALLGYHLLYRTAAPAFIEVTTADHKSFKVLADGTKVWLNKRSTISYNKDYGKNKREIFLEGEAYFDVTKSKAIPLIIHASNVDIEVKGTAFNVNAYKENKEIQVALVRGLIEVTDKLDKNHKVLLKPNEKLVFSANPAKGHANFMVFSLASNTLSANTKWIADTLVFRKEKLKDLAMRMEKKYDLKIEVHSELLKEKRFSGTFTDETIDQALAALKQSYPLTYTINNRLVVIKD